MGMKKKTSIFTVIKVLIVSYVITALLLLILAALMYRMELGEKAVDGGIVLIYISACFFGGFLMGKIKKAGRFLWGLVIGCLYFTVLLIVSLLMKQDAVAITEGLFTSAALCIGSGALGGMLS